MYKHLIEKFNERFKEGDFIYKSKKWGEINFIEDVTAAIVDAPNKGKFYKDGNKINRVIYKIKFMTTKSVFVVWDKVDSVPITVLTGDMKAINGVWS